MIQPIGTFALRVVEPGGNAPGVVCVIAPPDDALLEQLTVIESKIVAPVAP